MPEQKLLTVLSTEQPTEQTELGTFHYSTLGREVIQAHPPQKRLGFILSCSVVSKHHLAGALNATKTGLTGDEPWKLSSNTNLRGQSS